MTYQTVAKHSIQMALTLMLALLLWVSYHQAMSTETSPMSCLAFCFIAGKVDMSQLFQSAYYSLAQNLGAILLLGLVVAWQNLGLYYIHFDQLGSSPPLQRWRHYYQRQRSKLKLLSLWTWLYQQGIIAPQIYS